MQHRRYSLMSEEGQLPQDPEKTESMNGGKHEEDV